MERRQQSTGDEDRVSLAPLDPETALRALLQVKAGDQAVDENVGPRRDDGPREIDAG